MTAKEVKATFMQNANDNMNLEVLRDNLMTFIKATIKKVNLFLPIKYVSRRDLFYNSVLSPVMFEWSNKR